MISGAVGRSGAEARKRLAARTDSMKFKELMKCMEFKQVTDLPREIDSSQGAERVEALPRTSRSRKGPPTVERAERHQNFKNEDLDR
jgi:hypothetical protein